MQSKKMKQVNVFTKQKQTLRKQTHIREVPGGPVIGTQCFQCWAPVGPDQETKSLQATQPTPPPASIPWNPKRKKTNLCYQKGKVAGVVGGK